MAALVLLVLSPALISYGRAMTRPSSLPWTMRSVEWLRANHGAAIVNAIERRYYQWTAPGTGGPGLTALPAVGNGSTSTTPKKLVPAERPPRIQPVIHPALPGEGVWRSTRPGKAPAVMVTVFRPEPQYPRVVAYVGWVSSKLTQLGLYPGRYEPPGASPRGPMDVPQSQRPRLLATFNSGFTYGDGHGGFAVNGRTVTPLIDGKATLVGYTDGRVNVITWHGPSAAPANVVLARQNASLLVDNGRPSAALTNSGADWGYTLGNSVLVWRSAVGVDAHGNLIYAAADYQTTQSLAQLMVRAGAVRAMEFDINAEWPTFNYYRRAGAAGATMLVPNYQQSTSRYLVPDDRDFFAVFARNGPGNPSVPLS